ncbi:hypothetical protein [Marisediminicola sp. LYQ134]|uniref:hypothetical protein n=1 Tax=Marisediminicola sp. LYQ134 TaxID=3391061 RepID=UPI003983889E
MTLPPRRDSEGAEDDEDDTGGSGPPSSGGRWRGSGHWSDRLIKIQLVGAAVGTVLVAPVLILPAGWIRTTWIVIAVLLGSLVVIRVYIEDNKKEPPAHP